MRKWEHYEHTADIGVRGYGSTLEEAFEAVALGLFDVMVNVKKVEPKECREVEVEEEDLEALLYSFLEELLVLHDMEGLVFGDVKVRIEDRERLQTQSQGLWRSSQPRKARAEGRSQGNNVPRHED